jgi:hypothetical protein
MLIATLIAYFLLSGGSTLPFARTLEATTADVKKVVPDGAQRKSALSVLEEMDKVAKRYEKARKELDKTLGKLAESRMDSAQGLEAAYVMFENERVATEEQLVELRFRLKDSLTRAEWGKVFPAK